MFLFCNFHVNTESQDHLGQNKNTITVCISLQLKYEIWLSVDSQGKTFQAHRKSAFHYKVTVLSFSSTLLSKQETENGGRH